MTDLLDVSDISILSLSDDCILKDRFYVVKENIFTDILPGILQDIKTLQNHHCLQPSKMSRGTSEYGNAHIRGDRMCWVTPNLCKENNLQTLPILTQRLIKACGPLKKALGLASEYSVQLAEYAGNGEGYWRHRDAFPLTISNAVINKTSCEVGKGIQRQLTWIYYVNDPEVVKGGDLRLYDPHSASVYADIAPVAGRLVVFNSTVVEHEVMPAFSPRLAITFWASGTGAHYSGDVKKSVYNGAIYSSTTTEGQAPGNMTDEPLLHELSLSARTSRRLPLPLPAPAFNKLTSLPRIFVSIAAYRDSELQHTIRDMYRQCVHPERVYAGVVWQGEPGDEDTCFRICTSLGLMGWKSSETLLETTPEPGGSEVERAWWQTHVRLLKMHSTQATGPCWARHLAGGLWQGEEYVLQIDSHMRFRYGWDSYLIELHRVLQDGGVAKPVLSSYPLGYRLPDEVPLDTRATYLVPSHFDEHGLLRLKARALVPVDNSSQPALAPVPNVLWAAGFSFSAASILHDCPYDPCLPYLFFGEEQSMSKSEYI